MTARYEIVIDERAVRAVGSLPVYDRARLATHIAEQLTYEPTRPTGRKKRLRPLAVPWAARSESPWQLRIDPFRVLYDVDETAKVVLVRSVRRKTRSKTEELP
ncbi:MAG: hypothetical protein HY744_10065 [Deltaproteobacteria bacterium]|nr:hypothetical protein [Deltaproteobacteria bacterium]